MSFRLTRRDFMEAMGVLGAGAALGGLACGEKKPDPAQIRNYMPGMNYRRIGTTDLYPSVLSFGSGRAEAEVMNAGLEMGINYIHTSTRYSKGQSIRTVAEVIKGRRKKVYLAVKDNFETIEEALEILGTDYIDIVFFNRHNAEKLKGQLGEIREKFEGWKKKGQVKYVGLTTHKEMDACMDTALEAGFFHCLNPTFGPKQFEEFTSQKAACREKKVGIVAMKSKGELDGADYEKQIRLVLTEPAVSSINKGIRSLEDLEAWARAAVGAKTGFISQRRLERCAEGSLVPGCAMCGECEKVCPKGLRVADVVRCVRYYHDAEKDPAGAQENFKELAGAEVLNGCIDCGECEKACPQRVAIRKEMKRAGAMLA